MQALCWQGKHNVDIRSVPDPRILNPHDAIIKVTTAAICGSDLHLYDGYIPTMQKGDILGHETMGEVVEVGPMIKKLKVGDRVVIPFDISCGHCNHCVDKNYSFCDNTNPNASMADKQYGYSGAAMFGYSHMFGGYAGGQSQFLRVPFADTNSLLIPAGIADEKVLFLSDIFPTGYMAAENCEIKPGDTIAIWGAGPVGQMAARSAFLLGAERVIVIDRIEGRLKMAEDGGAETINSDECEKILCELSDLTGGRGPDACIDAVGMEAHGQTAMAEAMNTIKESVGLQTDRPDALSQAIQACGKGGTVSIPGVYGGFLDKVPFGAAFAKGLTFRMGQTHTQRYLEPLLDKILQDEIDPSFVITHRLSLEEGPEGYKTFHENKDDCIKVVLKVH